MLTAELIEKTFLPGFGDAALGATPTDSAVFAVGNQRLAFTTDSYVVNPLFFPGGNIGELAVFGTVNDLAMAGAVPIGLSTAFILEEGLERSVLDDVAHAMGAAAGRAGVRLMTGDTKVVDAGLADGMYINTAGVGVVPDGIDIRPERAQEGDVVILSGPVGLHGMAVLSVREGLEFGTDLQSDCAPLHGLVGALLAAVPNTHVLRDLTRGGLGAALSEIAQTADVGIRYIEDAVPVPEAVAAACGFLGLDPIHVANEGKMVAIVAANDAEPALQALRAHPLGHDAVIIGEVLADNQGRVLARTPLGVHRIMQRPLGEQLPRIC